MDVLELRMNYSAFIKLRNFVKINDISAEIKDYNKNEDVINGKLDVCGNYLEEDLVKSNNFNEEIPFSIIFKHENYETPLSRLRKRRQWVKLILNLRRLK